MKVKCKKEGCKYEQEWEGVTFEFFENWMKNYIKSHSKDMKCLHEIEEVKDEL